MGWQVEAYEFHMPRGGGAGLSKSSQPSPHHSRPVSPHFPEVQKFGKRYFLAGVGVPPTRQIGGRAFLYNPVWGFWFDHLVNLQKKTLVRVKECVWAKVLGDMNWPISKH